MLNTTDLHPNKLTKDFFKMSISERVEKFKDYSLEEQYELFLFGNQVVHPPAIYLVRPFAEQGRSIVPFLKTKIEATDKEATIRDIVMVFSELARLKLYDFGEDPELMELLKRKADNMKGIWKEKTLERISKMEQ